MDEDNFSSQNQKFNQEPWSPDKIRQHADKWSLAGDAGLLLLLQRIGDKVVARSKETLEQIDELSRELTKTNIDVSNLNNQFMGLQHTQFIESRVYEEDETCNNDESNVTNPVDKNKSDDPFENVEVTRSIIEDGLRVLRTHFDRVEVPNSDSDDDLDEPSFILRPKDDFSETSLPFVIGSEDWFAHDHVGLRKDESLESINELIDSDEKESADFKIPETDSGSSFGDISGKADLYANDMKTHDGERIPKRHSSSNSETGYDPPSYKSASFNETLTEKLNNVIEKKIYSPPILNDQDIYGKPETEKISRPKPIKSRTDGLFFDEPPPIDEVDQQDLFASVIGDNKFMPSEGGLFDDFQSDNPWDIETNLNPEESLTNKFPAVKDFQDEKVAHKEESVKKTLDTAKSDKKKVDTMGLFGDDNDSDDLFSNLSKPKEKTVKEKNSSSDEILESDTRKKPIGGISYLGSNREIINQSISNAIKSRQKLPSDSSEISEHSEKKAEIPEPKLPVKSSDSNQDSKIEDTFESNPTKKSTPKPINLFADDFNDPRKKTRNSLFEEDDENFDFLNSKSAIKKDLFSNKSNASKIVDKVEDKNTDLFSKNDTDLFSEIKSNKTKPSKPISLFDDEPPPLDLVGSELSNDDIFSPNINKSTDLFKDVDDVHLFGDSEENADLGTKKDSDFGSKKSKPRSLFDNLSDNLFETQIEKRNDEIVKPSDDSSNDDKKLKTISNKTQENALEEAVEDKTEKSSSKNLLFDNPEEDLFSSKKSTINVISKEKSKDESIFNTGSNEKQSIEKTTDSPNPIVTKQSSPKKIAHSLNINVAALLPGATRPKSVPENIKPVPVEEPAVREDNQRGSSEEKSQTVKKIVNNDSLDNIEKIETLHSLTQERARIQTKRRPSTRRARKEALTASENMNQPEIEPIQNSEETNPQKLNNLEDSLTSNNSKIINERITERANQNYMTAMPKEILFEEEILSKPDSKPVENIEPKEQPNVSQKKKISLFDSIDETDVNSDNLFGDTSVKVDNEPKKTLSSSLFSESLSKPIPNFLEEDSDDIFKILSVKTKETPKIENETKTQKNENISVVSEANIPQKLSEKEDFEPPKPRALEKRQKKISIFDDDDDDDDLFSTKTSKSSNLPVIEDDSLIFTPSSNSNKIESSNLQKSVSDNIDGSFNKKARNLVPFEDSNADIFSVEKPAPQKKTDKKKDVFEDTSNVDIFSTENSALQKKTEKMKDVFEDSSNADIFSDEKPALQKKTDKKKDAFEDSSNADIFSVEKPALQKQMDRKKEVKSLFGDEDDDDDSLFGGTSSKKTVKPIVSNKKLEIKSSKVGLANKTNSKKLFDDEDDDDDLFSSKPRKGNSSNKNVPSTSEKKVNQVPKTLVYDDPLMFKESD